MKKRQIICVFAQRQFRQYIVVDPNKEKVQVKVEVPTTGRLLSLTMIFCHMAGGRVVELTVIFARLAKFEPTEGCSGEDISVRGSNSSGGKYRPLHQALTRVIYFCSQSWEMFRQEHNFICPHSINVLAVIQEVVQLWFASYSKSVQNCPPTWESKQSKYQALHWQASAQESKRYQKIILKVKWQSPLGCGGKIASTVLFVFLCYLCSPVGHVCWGHKQITHLVKLGRWYKDIYAVTAIPWEYFFVAPLCIAGSHRHGW